MGRSIRDQVYILAAHQYWPRGGWTCLCGESFADQLDFTKPAQCWDQFRLLLAEHQVDELLLPKLSMQQLAELRRLMFKEKPW